MKKKFFSVLLVFVLALSLFAGGASESGSKTVELEMLLSDDTLEGGAMADAVARFTMELNASCSQPTLDNDVRNAHAGSSWGNATRDTFDKVIAGEMTVEEMIPYVVSQIRAAYPEMK